METMPLNPRSRVVRSLLFTAAWLSLAALAFDNPPTSRGRELEPGESLATSPGGQDFYGQQEPDMQVPDDYGEMPLPGGRARPRSSTTKKTRQTTAKGVADSADKTKKGSTAAPAAKQTPGEKSGSTGTGISFRNDVAPILVANCVGCHQPGAAGPGQRQARHDLIRQADAGNAQGEGDRAGKTGREPPPLARQGRRRAADAAGRQQQRALRARRSARSKNGSKPGPGWTRVLIPRPRWKPMPLHPSRCAVTSLPGRARKTAIRKSAPSGSTAGSRPIPN